MIVILTEEEWNKNQPVEKTVLNAIWLAKVVVVDRGQKGYVIKKNTLTNRIGIVENSEFATILAMHNSWR